MVCFLSASGHKLMAFNTCKACVASARRDHAPSGAVKCDVFNAPMTQTRCKWLFILLYKLQSNDHLIGTANAEQRRCGQKRQSESDSESKNSGDRKRSRLEGPLDSQVSGDTPKSQFEMLALLAQEIQDMGIQLGRVAVDVAETHVLIRALIPSSRIPCGICSTCEERSIYSDPESQVP